MLCVYMYIHLHLLHTYIYVINVSLLLLILSCYQELVDAMTKARFNIGIPMMEVSQENALEHQTTALNQSKQLLKCTQEFITKGSSSMKQMFTKASEVKTIYCQLVETTRRCLATIKSDQVCFHDDRNLLSPRRNIDNCLILLPTCVY